MAVLSPIPAGQVILQTGNGQNLISWPIQTGANGYALYRSSDGITFGLVDSFTANYYVDTSVFVGQYYYYSVAANNSSGLSATTASFPASICACLPGQINLGYLRYQSQLKADQLNSNFLTLDEWNININKSMFELFDILVTKFGDDFFLASPYTISTTGAKNYPLPNGSASFAVNGVTPPAVYKLLGIDCGVAVGNNAWVTLPRYNWIDRNRFVYPQLQANALGVFNLSYRQMGNELYFIPNPTAGQYIQIWYVPIMTTLLQDTDMLSFSISGWDEYVVTDAAIKAATKEESYDLVASLKMDKAALLARIETTAANRDVGQPNTISDTRSNTGFYDGGGFGGSGHGMAGWIAALIPNFMSHHCSNGIVMDSIFSTQGRIAYAAIFIAAAYFFYLASRENGGGVFLTRTSNPISFGISSLFDHIRMIFCLSSKKKMIWSHAGRHIALMARMKRFIGLSIMKPIRCAVGANCESFSLGPTGDLKSYSSIAFTVKRSHPNPALSRFLNLRPKFIFKRFLRNHDRSLSQEVA